MSSTKGSEKRSPTNLPRDIVTSLIISFIRRRLRFDLVKTCSVSFRGFHGTKSTVVASPVDDIDLNLINSRCWVNLSDPSG